MSSSPEAGTLRMGPIARVPWHAVVLVTGEVLWISLCLSALANTWPHFAMSVPFGVLLLPALVGLAVGRIATRRNTLAAKVVIAAAGALVVIAAGAAALAAQSLSGAALRTAFAPFSAAAGTASAVTTLAWLDVALVVVRAIEVAMTRESVGRTARSVVAGSGAYFVLFLSIATQHSARLDAVTHGITWAFLGYFVLAIGSLRLTRAATAEGGGAATRLDARWRFLLAVPVVAVVLCALIVADALGSNGGALHRALRAAAKSLAAAGALVGHGIATGVVAVATAVADAIGFLVGLVVHRRAEAPWTRVVHAPGHAPTTTSGPPPTWLLAVLIAAFAASATVVLVRSVRRVPHSATSRPAMTERSSTFTWRHLGAQILSAVASVFRGLARGLRRPRAARDSILVPAPPGLRREYQLLLVRAQRLGLGRHPSETPREYAARLGDVLDDESASALAAVTDSYEQLRYGERDAPGDARAACLAVADRLAAGARPT